MTTRNISEALAHSLELIDRTRAIGLGIPEIGTVYGAYMILLGLAIRRGIVSDSAILEAASREYGRQGAKTVSETLEHCVEVSKKYDIQQEESK